MKFKDFKFDDFKFKDFKFEDFKFEAVLNSFKSEGFMAVLCLRWIGRLFCGVQGILVMLWCCYILKMLFCL